MPFLLTHPSSSSPIPFFILVEIIILAHAIAHNVYINWGYWAPAHGKSLFCLFPPPPHLFSWTTFLLQDIYLLVSYFPSFVIIFVYTLLYSNKRYRTVFKLVCQVYFTQHIFRCIHFPTNVSNGSFFIASRIPLYIDTSFSWSSHLLASIQAVSRI